MYNIISRVLRHVPGNFFGSASKDAARTLSAWTKHNRTLAEHKPSRFRSILYWGSDNATGFALLVAGLCLLISVIAWPSFEEAVARIGWSSGEASDFRLSTIIQAQAIPNIAEFIGVPWGIQATLIALVYPIVISFVALMLQRRAQAAVAMRVYAIDSGVVPAGASSLGLLAALTFQYFSAETFKSEYPTYLTALFLFNGIWFALNLGLTAHFLNRTLRFLSPEEQSQAVKRICVARVLPRDFLSSLNSHIFENKLSRTFSQWQPHGEKRINPRVTCFKLHEGDHTVTRDVKDGYLLTEVHLGLLQFVTRRWYKRAERYVSQSSNSPPTLMFPQKFFGTVRGETTLCIVANGPPLTAFEALLVRLAFFFTPPDTSFHHLTASEVLEELSGTCQMLAEQGQYEQARRAARELLEMVRTFLRASSFQGEDGPENVANLPVATLGWPGPNFHVEWLETYREVVRVAVEHLKRDSRLLESLAHVPQLIAGALPARPEQVAIESMFVYMNIDHQLTLWWLRHSVPGGIQGGVQMGRTLPAPMDQVYLQVLAQLVGIWSHMHVPLPSGISATVHERWNSASARVKVMAAHVDWSAALVQRAVSRGDEIAAVRYCDHFIKWWGLNDYDLPTGNCEFEDDLRHIGLSVLGMRWEDAKWALHRDGVVASIDRGINTQNLALKRYWERMRLLLALTLIRSAVRTSTAAVTLEIRLATALILHTPLKPGGDVEAENLGTLDAVLAAILNACFGDSQTTARLNAFSERLEREARAPDVPNWSFGGAWPDTSMEAMVVEQVCLLIAVADGDDVHPNLRASRFEVTRWWRDVRKLESIKLFVNKLHQAISSTECLNSIPAVEQMRSQMGKDRSTGSALQSVERTLKMLSELCTHEKIVTLRSRPVSMSRVLEYAATLGSLTFNPERLPLQIPAVVRFEPELGDTSVTATERHEKVYFLSDSGETVSRYHVEASSVKLFYLVVCEAFSALVRTNTLSPIACPPLKHHVEDQDGQKQSFVVAVANNCARIFAAGESPIVLVPRGPFLNVFRSFSWSRSGVSVPANIVLREAGSADAFPGATYINDAPIIEFDTPGNDCFVVPLSALRVLVVRGSSGSDALGVTFVPHGDAHVQLSFKWSAVFRSN